MAQCKTQCATYRMKCRNPPIVFTCIRSPRAKSTSTRIRSHFLTEKPTGRVENRRPVATIKTGRIRMRL